MESKNNETVSLSLKGKLYPTTESRSITSFFEDYDDSPPTSKVAICISGGGSVSMMSTLGQLRALRQMGVLDKAQTISTVSGGSWATVLFTFLPQDITDEEFLGTYVPNPADLRLDDSKGAASNLKTIGANYMGKVVSAKGISAASMTDTVAALLGPKSDFPAYKVWNYLMAKNVLEPFGLGGAAKMEVGTHGKDVYKIAENWFAYNEKHSKELIAQNPALGNVPYFTYCQEKNVGEDIVNIKRPYHLCNTSMFVVPNGDFEKDRVAPVQCNAIATGIFATDIGTPGEDKHVERQQAGGGLVSSHAFNSTLKSVGADNSVEVSVENGELFSLTDITANSSAFYATMKPDVKDVAVIDPKYLYWAVADADASKAPSLTPFADGGAIEDNGLLNALAYDDIDKAVVFVNALKSLTIDGDEVSEDYMNVVVDNWIPSYFGYTSYQSKASAKKHHCKEGYNKYSELSPEALDSGLRELSSNQIFDSALFGDFLKTIHDNSNDYTQPAVFHSKKMTVMDNNYYGIKSRDIELLLVHYGPYQPFYDALDYTIKNDPEFIEYMENNANELNKHAGNNIVHDMFPNYIITETHMPPMMLNLLAHFTCTVAMTQADTIKSMFGIVE